MVGGVQATTWKFEQELRKEMPPAVKAKLGEPMGKPSVPTGQSASSIALAVPKNALITFDEDGNKLKPALADASSEDIKVMQ